MYHRAHACLTWANAISASVSAESQLLDREDRIESLTDRQRFQVATLIADYPDAVLFEAHVRMRMAHTPRELWPVLKG